MSKEKKIKTEQKEQVQDKIKTVKKSSYSKKKKNKKKYIKWNCLCSIDF